MDLLFSILCFSAAVLSICSLYDIILGFSLFFFGDVGSFSQRSGVEDERCQGHFLTMRKVFADAL